MASLLIKIRQKFCKNDRITREKTVVPCHATWSKFNISKNGRALNLIRHESKRCVSVKLKRLLGKSGKKRQNYFPKLAKKIIIILKNEKTKY